MSSIPFGGYHFIVIINDTFQIFVFIKVLLTEKVTINIVFCNKTELHKSVLAAISDDFELILAKFSNKTNWCLQDTFICDLSVLFMRIQNLVTFFSLFVISCKSCAAASNHIYVWLNDGSTRD